MNYHKCIFSFLGATVLETITSIFVFDQPPEYFVCLDKFLNPLFRHLVNHGFFMLVKKTNKKIQNKMYHLKPNELGNAIN